MALTTSCPNSSLPFTWKDCMQHLSLACIKACCLSPGPQHRVYPPKLRLLLTLLSTH